MVESADPGPAQILASLDRLMRRTLRQEATTSSSDAELGPVNNDGLDAAILQVDRERGVAVFAGARLPLLVERGGTIERVKGDRVSLGYADSPLDHQFAETVLPVEPGLRFFVITDGVTDQIGGPRRRAFGHRRLIRKLADGSGNELETVLAGLLAAVDRYAGGEVRRDDLTILAVEPHPA
jgi:serine phosphatase RsbU (regulator of sigma subunit)